MPKISSSSDNVVINAIESFFKIIFYVLLNFVKIVCGYSFYILIFPSILWGVSAFWNFGYSIYRSFYNVFGDLYNRGWSGGMSNDIHDFSAIITGLFGGMTILYSIPFLDSITWGAMLITYLIYCIKLFI